MATYKLDDAARYARTHEWVRLEGDLAVVGISDAAQDMLSDVVYVELPEVGRTVQVGDSLAVVESVKAAEEVIAPVSGIVTEVNDPLVDQPELVNQDPYGSWFVKIQPTEALSEEVSALFSPADYQQFVEQGGH